MMPAEYFIVWGIVFTGLGFMMGIIVAEQGENDDRENDTDDN